MSLLFEITLPSKRSQQQRYQARRSQKYFALHNYHSVLYAKQETSDGIRQTYQLLHNGVPEAVASSSSLRLLFYRFLNRLNSNSRLGYFFMQNKRLVYVVFTIKSNNNLQKQLDEVDQWTEIQQKFLKVFRFIEAYHRYHEYTFINPKTQQNYNMLADWYKHRHEVIDFSTRTLELMKEPPMRTSNRHQKTNVYNKIYIFEFKELSVHSCGLKRAQIIFKYENQTVKFTKKVICHPKQTLVLEHISQHSCISIAKYYSCEKGLFKGFYMDDYHFDMSTFLSLNKRTCSLFTKIYLLSQLIHSMRFLAKHNIKYENLSLSDVQIGKGMCVKLNNLQKARILKDGEVIPFVEIGIAAFQILFEADVRSQYLSKIQAIRLGPNPWSQLIFDVLRSALEVRGDSSKKLNQSQDWQVGFGRNLLALIRCSISYLDTVY